MQEIIITKWNAGDFDVTVGDRHAHKLTWDEMLGQIAYMTHPILGREYLYRMSTDAEDEAERVRREQRRLENETLTQDQTL